MWRSFERYGGAYQSGTRDDSYFVFSLSGWPWLRLLIR
jgi:hypothetical protein